jgi:ABC-type transporter Mla subunit MlaD
MLASRRNSYGRLLLPTAIAAAVAVLVIVFVLLLTGSSGSTTYHLYAGFTNADQMVSGQQVRMAGREVGEIGTIKLSRQTGTAVVEFNITDDAVWPLPQGSYAIARWGSNTSYLGRYTELIAGPRKNPPLKDDGILTPQQDQSAFELDEAYNIFRGPTARQTQELVNRLGQTLDSEGGALQRGVAATPSGLNQAANLLDSLSQNEYDLKTLASAGDSTLTALNDRSGQLQSLVSTAAGTFSTFSQHTAAEQSALEQASPALSSARTTFGRLDTSLTRLTSLVTDIRPGAPLLAQLATQASRTLTTLRTVAPEATQTLQDGIGAAPELSKLFSTGNTVLPNATKAIRTATPMLACIRPYTPDISGFLTTWSGFTSHYDAGGHYARTVELTSIPALLPGTANDPAKAIAQSPGITYAMPRPPGMNEGRPYFLPQCGVTAAALNPADDPEAGK